MATSTIVRVQRAYDCTAEAVYDAWLDPQLARRFWFATSTGEVIRCTIEPNVNGRFTIVDRRRLEAGPDTEMDVEHTGRFLQLDRPRRIAFSFGLPQFQSHETTVIVDIEPQGDGCLLTLRHDLGPADEEATEMLERAEGGWTTVLENLEKTLKGQ
ncbi:SRPBCC family protein [Ramlibacter humi]|uniref:SRPBCC domain-containing protein n=1 Tax=Ramlibacter humi TaxID=2530451 RepID=A0A4Z0BV95_9BURK|nr:SRPBCC domain-containing protein [Ramlibacter humi]TFZ01909.1 SRPBCC domain-containing protein [Ramlibacter humi]